MDQCLKKNSCSDSNKDNISVLDKEEEMLIPNK